MTTFQIFRQITFSPARSGKPRSTNSRSGWKAACAALLFCAATSIVASAQTYTVLALGPGFWYGNFAQGIDGDFYGVANGNEVIKVTPTGTLKTISTFPRNTYGDTYATSLILGTDGNFYGTTMFGPYGPSAYGSLIFRLTPGGGVSILYQFCPELTCLDGNHPSKLVEGTDGNFYGTTSNGGANGQGTIFRVTPAGELTTLYSFCALANCPDGTLPGALVQASDGNFYGATFAGANGGGTVFKVTPSGRLTTLYSFCAETNCADGSLPEELVEASDGSFYGMTYGGGISSSACPSYGCGTIFEISRTGKLITLHRFDSSDGASPNGPLIQATDQNFYSTTVGGGANNAGTIFKITPAGSFATLHSFQDGEGLSPVQALIQSTNGSFYGTTFVGGGENLSRCGRNGCGTFFRLSAGMRPHVSLIRSSGIVGTTVQILGQGFTGTSEVSFNGTPAKFTVISDTYLTATVPAGAEWGFVTVTTPRGIIKSNVRFRVTPQIFSNTPTSGPMGTTVVIQGMSFHRTYAITFGNVKATDYTVASDTQITVTVPAGAEKGKIAVLTPGGTAYSPTCFDVTE